MYKCDKCGEEITHREEGCSYCGNKLLETETLNGMSEEIKEESDVSRFVGSKYPYYEKKWEKSQGSKPSWNFAAFFLSIFWLGYRKMYIPLAIIIGAFFLMDFLIYIFYDQNTTDSIINSLNQSISIGIATSLGIFGNNFYMQHVNKRVTAIKEKALSPEDKDVQLRKKGGTSWLGVFVALFALITYAILASFLFPTADDKISAIKDGVFEELTDETVGEKFDQFFVDPQWELVKNDTGKETIHFTGKKEEANVLIVFIDEGDYFDIHQAKVDGFELNEEELNEMLYYIFVDAE